MFVVTCIRDSADHAMPRSFWVDADRPASKFNLQAPNFKQTLDQHHHSQCVEFAVTQQGLADAVTLSIVDIVELGEVISCHG